jgi:UDP-N-acetylglucosamine--N-acetylmuramyl-(pentapeptide) pyrophosphoryl-undecaprenol N-acetylglucosamine transferase
MGARVLSEIIPAAIALLPTSLREKIIITQQCREEDQVLLESKYKKIKQKCEIRIFFNDISSKIKNAHLVVSRAGASTVAELGVVGRPAIFIPYRFAMDDHQTMNANAMVMAGGAWCFNEVELTPLALATSIEAILTDEKLLISKAASARSFGTPDAVNRLADLVFTTGEKNSEKTSFEPFGVDKTEFNRGDRYGEKL